MHIFAENFDSIFFLGVKPLLNLEIWPKLNILLKQFVIATPLKLLHRVSWSFVVIKDIPWICASSQGLLIRFFSLRVKLLLNLENWTKLDILLKQFISTIPLKPLNIISCCYLCMCILTGISDLNFFWENRDLGA